MDWSKFTDKELDKLDDLCEKLNAPQEEVVPLIKYAKKDLDKVTDLVCKHGMTVADAISIVEDDKTIEHGGKTDFDLSDEEHKKAMKNANVDTHSTKGEKVKRERKPNEVKRSIINYLCGKLEDAHLLEENEPVSGVKSVKIANIEREITFEIDGTAFSITLTQHRPPKS